MSKKEKQPKQPKTIKVKTVLVAVVVVVAAVACGLGVNYLRDEAYSQGYGKGYDTGVKSIVDTDTRLMERAKELKAFVTELK